MLVKLCRSFIAGVTYVVDGRCIAVGFPQPERNTLHGKEIPDSCICVQILAVKEHYPAPVVCGTQQPENEYLTVNCFYCLPRCHLKSNIIKDGTLVLEDY